MMKPISTLLSVLADGQFHSGSELGNITGRSRSAVWKSIQSLRDSGIEIFSVHGKGYRLSNKVELLEYDRIAFFLDTPTKNKIKDLEIHFELASTNSYLMESIEDEKASGIICLAEQQTSGRGRRGKSWVSPFGGNLYLSLLWHFNNGAAHVAGLSLAVAIAVSRVLREFGLNSVSVKWPNDILVSNKKLAGILLEIAGEASGPCSVVLGIGMNLKAEGTGMSTIDQPWIDLESALGREVSRNELAAKLINHLYIVIEEFEKNGLTPFLPEWQELDNFAEQEVVLHLPDKEIRGIVRGVDNTGALLLAQAGEVRRYLSGEISMRATTN